MAKKQASMPEIPDFGEERDQIEYICQKGFRRGAFSSEELRVAQRKLVLLARDATDAAVQLYGLIRVSDNEEKLSDIEKGQQP